MNDYRCPPVPLSVVSLVLCTARAGYSLTVMHRHPGFPIGGCEADKYEAMTLAELRDLVEAVLDTTYPGVHPHGQLSIWEVG